jgi:hypothetical protein
MRAEESMKDLEQARESMNLQHIEGQWEAPSRRQQV